VGKFSQETLAEMIGTTRARVELCFPQLGQPSQSFIPFSKIENDAP
jgi:hypothetical protein